MQTNLSKLRSLRASQAGFTLVEIAIVLVIIGLLLGGVLKGQELIENGRVKSAAAEFNGISTAHNSYFDRYRRIPGDDGPNQAALVARGGQWANIAATAFGNANGSMVETIAFGPTGEGIGYFSHLRAAGFITGNAALVGAAALPVNAWGGSIGVITTTVALPIQARTSTILLVCMGSVPGKAAQALDTQLDDGQPATGTLRATIGALNTEPLAVPAAGVAYSENNVYTICRDLF